MSGVPSLITAGLTLEDAPYVEATRRWVARAVVGLNLCPFARAPFIQGRIRYAVSHARDTDALLDDLCGELQSLAAADAAECETTLLIHPHVLGDFLDYNDFLDVADAAVETLKLDGVLQVASFHPHYQFADTTPDDVENATNRSPFPTLHLLREASVERAAEAMSDPDEIYRRNIDTLRKLGPDGWKALGTGAPEAAQEQS
ncbi:DUF1415 domain-containing protein [Dyella sp. KRB-257]|uniref:DUF1415 domain-containing protein n=1 Tax=Dyella sp. KRB-257 TaxID=3400915 RepID=UPI003C06F0C0